MKGENMNRIRNIALIVSVLVFVAIHTGLIRLQPALAAPGDLTKTVTHGPLTATTASMHLELKDNGVIVISQNFSESYTQSRGLTSEVENSIVKKMQAAIDAYRILEAEKVRAGYINAPGRIEGNLDLTKEL